MAALERDPQPAVVLLDVVLPGMNGFDVCRQIKANAATLAPSVMLVTGFDRWEDQIRGIEAGADDFLSKPVEREELVRRVRVLIRLGEARRRPGDRRALEDGTTRARPSNA